MPHQDKPEHITQQLELLRIHRRTLHHLLVQQAQQGGLPFTDPRIRNGIDEARSNIARIKGHLRNSGLSVDNQPDDSPDVDSNPPGVVLESEQEVLLSAMIEASERIPRSQRTKFLIYQGDGRTMLAHPGIPTGLDVYEGDLETLAALGLIHLTVTPRKLENCDVTPLGMQYYKFLKQRPSAG